jgi:RNA polymerase sigma-70 factor (ECF subfamily)
LKKNASMDDQEQTISELLDRVLKGDAAAIAVLLQAYRDRMRQAIAIRMDARLARRVDPSDVIQEALITAAARLPDYAVNRPIALYPWLRQIAMERLIDIQRRHSALKRDVRRECELPLTDQSISQLASQFVDQKESSPTQGIDHQEQREAIYKALQSLSPVNREILVMKYLEGMPNPEIADALSLTEASVKARQRRALQKLHETISKPS